MPDAAALTTDMSEQQHKKNLKSTLFEDADSHSDSEMVTAEQPKLRKTEGSGLGLVGGCWWQQRQVSGLLYSKGTGDPAWLGLTESYSWGAFVPASDSFHEHIKQTITGVNLLLEQNAMAHRQCYNESARCGELTNALKGVSATGPARGPTLGGAGRAGGPA
eukprot:26833-Rhodomonas_salina.3